MPELRTTVLRTSGRVTTCLGFGMATLMREPSRYVRRGVLERAYELGIRHFDVAPLYGLGRAEPELGEFLSVNGITDATVVTKFGLAPSRRARLVAPIQGPIRSAMRRSELIRRLGKSAERSSGTVQALPPAILGESVERSLEQLRVDRVDALILHEVRWDRRWADAWDDLQEGAGYAGLGVSGTSELLDSYPTDAMASVGVIQGPPGLTRALAAQQQRIHHSVINELTRPLAAALAGLGRDQRDRLRELVERELDAEAVRSLAIASLWADQPGSVVLVGTTRVAHLEALVDGVSKLLGRVSDEDKAILANLLRSARGLMLEVSEGPSR